MRGSFKRWGAAVERGQAVSPQSLPTETHRLCPAPAGPVLPSSCSHGLGEHGPDPHLVPYSFGAGRQWRQWGWGDRFLFFPVSGLPAGSVPHSVLTEPSGAPVALTHTRPTPGGAERAEEPESLPWPCVTDNELCFNPVTSHSPEWTLWPFLQLERERERALPETVG